MNKFNSLTLLTVLFANTTTALATFNYSKSDLEKYFTTKECVSCDLSNAHLGRLYDNEIDRSQSYLDRANLSETKFNGNFSNSSLINAILTRASNYISYQDQPLSFTDTNFTGANLSASSFVRVDFSSSNFTNVKFNNANLSKSNFANSDFTNAVLVGANLKNTNFSGSNITEEQLKQAKYYCGAILPSGDVFECE